MDNKKCPVCEIDLSYPFHPYCTQCGWDLKHDITLVPSLHEIPENVLESYKGQVAIARRNWRERLEAIKRQKELEEEIEKFRAEKKALEGQKGSKEERKVEEKTYIPIQLDPNDAVTYYNRGVVHYENGQYDKAIAYYSRAIQLSPKYARAYSYRALAYKKLDKYEEAESDIRKARELSGN